jgi:hypothetical protein
MRRSRRDAPVDRGFHRRSYPAEPRALIGLQEHRTRTSPHVLMKPARPTGKSERIGNPLRLNKLISVRPH